MYSRIGRVINVEKSTGGKDAEKRKQKIAEFKERQNHKVADKITAILEEYQARGVISIAGEWLYHSGILFALAKLDPSWLTYTSRA